MTNKIIALAKKIKHFIFRENRSSIKGILIFGAVRTGKSTLARHLSKKFFFSIIENDILISALECGFPELGCSHSCPDETKEKYRPFFYKLLNDIPRRPYPLSVIPISQTTLSDLYNYPRIQDYLVITLGYINFSVDELVEFIRIHEGNSWTSSFNDEKLRRICEKILSQSKELEKLSNSYGFYFFDVSKKRKKVFKKICHLVKQKVYVF